MWKIIVKCMKRLFNSVVLLFFVSFVFASQVKLPSSLKYIYDKVPNLEKGEIGVLSNKEKQDALNEVNAIRKLHKLPLITYDISHQLHMDKAALIIAGNGRLTHVPAVTDKFYSKEGGWGCYNGNLFLEKHTILSFKKTNVKLEDLNLNKTLKTLNPKIATAKEIVDAFLIDEQVATLGHRRWILNPFLSSTTFGRVDGFSKESKYHFVTAAALKVIEYYKNNISNNLNNRELPDFVAYPFENYPFKLFKRYWYMSFSVIQDKKSFWNNKKVDFSNAIISIRDEVGNNIETFNIRYNNYPMGIPNCLQWKAKNIALNKTYHVTISHVLISGENINLTFKTYNYWFKLQK